LLFLFSEIEQDKRGRCFFTSGCGGWGMLWLSVSVWTWQRSVRRRHVSNLSYILQ